MSEGKSCRILIVDDEASSRMLLRVQLQAFGYALSEAADGAQAVERFKADKPDIILMDITMPIMDGYEAARQIKLLSPDNYVPILFVTGHDEESAIARSADAGGDDFLVKPLTPVVLQARIYAALQRRGLYQQLREQHRVLEHQKLHSEREHELAKDIFGRIAHLGCLDEAGIEYIASSLMVFSGDMLLAERTPYGTLRVMLGDFTGHGLPAAVGSLPSADIFYSMTANGYHVGEVAAEINAKLYDILPRGIFCAAALIELNSDTEQLTVWNGGLPHLLLYRRGDNSIGRAFESMHLALGILAPGDFDATSENCTVRSGDSLIAYSDGITETKNPDGELYGDYRLADAMVSDDSELSRFKIVMRDIDQFRRGAPPCDDATLIEIPCDLKNDARKEAASVQTPGKPASEWEHRLTLRGNAIAEINPVPMLMQALMHLQGLNRYREDLFTILTELYVNALDHGILKLDSSLKCSATGVAEYLRLREERMEALDSGYIDITLVHKPTSGGGRLSVCVEDSGDGFSEKRINHARALCDAHGRGLKLLRTLCTSLRYTQGGRIAHAEYDWSCTSKRCLPAASSPEPDIETDAGTQSA